MLKNYMRKMFLGLSLIVFMFGNTVFAQETDYGAVGASQKTNYSIEDMLRYALQDEYLARAEYEAIIDKYGEIRPFTNIISSEDQHILLLKPLFEKYNLKISEDISKSYVLIPETLSESFEVGVKAEIDNIAMYQKFLDQKDIPEDLKLAFETLKKASEKHLKAFERGVSRNK